MSDLKAIRLSTNYTDLRKSIENQNYAKIIRSSNKILNDVPSDVVAWQCKLTALIHLGNFSEGLQSLKKCKIVEEVLFEKAYCEYRLNQTEDAWNTLSSCQEDPPIKIKELQAQVLYRLERYEECYNIYRDLIKTTSDSFDQERLTNLGAVACNRAFEGTTNLCPAPTNDSTYEHLYNYACDQIASGKVSQALKKLREAEALCRKVMVQQDEATEEEVLDEIAIIRAQQGYCLQIMGKEKEALALYNSILKTKPDDIAIIAIINNNIVAINREFNVFDSKKRLKATVMPELEHKLTNKQKGAIGLNHCLMGYLTHQDDSCLNEIQQIRKRNADYDQQLTITEAALLGRSKKTKDLTLLLKKFIELKPEAALDVTLSAVQILLSLGEKGEALGMLLMLKEAHKYQPGIVATVVALCCSTGREKEASDILTKAVDWHKSHSKKSASLSDLWQHAARFHMRNGEPKIAIESLEALRQLKPKDINVLAQLIQAYSEIDKAKAQELSKELPSALTMLQSIDIEGLESSFSAKYTRKIKTDKDNKENMSPEDVKIQAKSLVKSKPKKKKKIKYPKNMVEGEEQDPERWMPRWQRAGTKGKRRFRKEVGTGTQGAGMGGEAMDKYDITKTSHARTNRNVSSPQADSMKRQQWKRPGQRRKKNK